jgi:multisubunit Na+/H+ antiporter MnhB subunit
MDVGPKSWLQQALGIAITLVVIALLLRWAWQLFSPLVPIVVGIIAVGVLIAAWKWYHQNRYW